MLFRLFRLHRPRNRQMSPFAQALLPHDLGTLRVQDTAPPIGSIPTGAELQERFANLEVHDYEITSEAERAWKHGDQMAGEDAAKKAP